MTEKHSHPDPLRFASLIAHQLKAPVSAVSSLLKMLVGGYAGPLTDQQKDLLNRAMARCDQGLRSAERMLKLVRLLEGGERFDGVADAAALVRREHLRLAEEADAAGLSFAMEINVEPAYVRGEESALAEVFDALVSNAFKYTPENGQVCLRVDADPRGELIHVRVADSGVGVPDEDREHIFQPFFRTSAARDSARPGAGLGLAFVKAVVEACGGRIDVGPADIGGAEFTITLPVAEEPQIEPRGEKHVSRPKKYVIIGGVAAGPKVASKIIRLQPDAEVTVVEKGKFLSYAGCGLPYYISGLVKDQKELISTAAGAVRDPVFFQKVKNVHVLSETEAMEIDCAGKRVRIRELMSNKESWLDYDKLVLATGAGPIVPDVPGVDLPNVFTLHGVNDAEGIKAALAGGKAMDVVIIGGGLIGVEMTEALVRTGCRVTIVEVLPQTLRILDWEMARLVERHMESKGVKVLTDTQLKRLEGDGEVRAVVTDKGSLAAGMVIMAVGIRANVALAKAAGLEIGGTGAIKVNEHMRTSDPDVYAAGDCVECIDILTGKPCFVPLGATANKQGRVAAVNVCGGSDSFPGVLGSTVCKVFDYCVARTGLTEAHAKELGYDVVTVLAPAPDRAHFMPTAKRLLLKLVVDARTGRLLGAQAIGPGAGDKRIDIAAMAITAGMTVAQLANADLCYAPPYSPVMDNIITAANVARNKMSGAMVGVSPVEVNGMIDEGKEFVLLDVRSPAEYRKVRLADSINVPLGSLRGRLRELPKDKPIVAFCDISLRAYEAGLILRHAGLDDVKVMDGGIAMWPFEKVE